MISVASCANQQTTKHLQGGPKEIILIYSGKGVGHYVFAEQPSLEGFKDDQGVAFQQACPRSWCPLQEDRKFITDSDSLCNYGRSYLRNPGTLLSNPHRGNWLRPFGELCNSVNLLSNSGTILINSWTLLTDSKTPSNQHRDPSNQRRSLLTSKGPFLPTQVPSHQHSFLLISTGTLLTNKGPFSLTQVHSQLHWDPSLQLGKPFSATLYQEQGNPFAATQTTHLSNSGTCFRKRSPPGEA